MILQMSREYIHIMPYILHALKIASKILSYEAGYLLGTMPGFDTFYGSEIKSRGLMKTGVR